MELWKWSSLCLWMCSVYLLCYCEQDACSGLCKCKHHHVYCVGLNLSYIPKVPNKTSKLTFNGNYLPVISGETLLNISQLKLIHVYFQNNSIHTIELNSLRTLGDMCKLKLSYNPLSNQTLFNVMTELNTLEHVNTLYLSGIGLKFIPKNLFTIMQRHGSKLKVLKLANNLLQNIDFTYFKNFINLEQIDFGFNRIKSVIFDKLTRLKVLNIQSNSFRDLPNFCNRSNVAIFPALTQLNINNNSIIDYIPEYINCLKKLEDLVLNRNSFRLIKTDSFYNIKSLSKVDLSSQRNPQSSLHIEEFAFNNSNLQTIELQKNNIHVKNIQTLAFSGCINLKVLILSNNKLNDIKYANKRFDKILAPLNSIEYLILQNTNLYTVPAPVRNFSRLVRLVLNSNFIVNLTEKWINNKRLTQLFLAYNKIQFVNKTLFPSSFRRQLKQVTFGNNPLECVCENVWFVQWIRKNKTLFLDYPNEYGCMSMTKRICLKNNALYMSVLTFSCILICVFILLSIVYKYRWFIKYQIYIWRHQPKIFQQMAERQFLYDIFLSYSADDSDWVHEYLVPKLEEDANLKLCIHERDFQAGRLIIDNIVESMENSRRVLIILSNNFSKSVWCQFELTLAQKHVLNMYIEPLTVVLLKEIEVENMSNAIHVLLKTTTYISWNINLEHIHLFWDQLKRALKI